MEEKGFSIRARSWQHVGFRGLESGKGSQHGKLLGVWRCMESLRGSSQWEVLRSIRDMPWEGDVRPRFLYLPILQRGLTLTHFPTMISSAAQSSPEAESVAPPNHWLEPLKLWASVLNQRKGNSSKSDLEHLDTDLFSMCNILQWELKDLGNVSSNCGFSHIT